MFVYFAEWALRMMPHRPDSVIFAATQCGLPIQQWDGAQIFWHHQQREKPESYSKGKTSTRALLIFCSKWRGTGILPPTLLRPLSVGQIPDYIRDKSVRYDSVDLMWITHNDLSWCSKRLWVQAYSQHFNLIDERETYLIGLFILFCRWRGQWQNNITREI